MISETRDLRSTLRGASRRAKAGLITVAEAAEAWNEDSRTAALRLADLARRGWAHRVRRGLYYLSSLEGGPNPVVEDPWVLADALFAPCYIGGWTAAHHWELTEQIFRSTFVVTAMSIRKREQTALGAEYRLVKVPLARIVAVDHVWRGSVRVRVSSPEQTLSDGFADPAWVGGLRQLADMLDTYRRSGPGREALLAEELERTRRGAAWKRAGYLAEALWPNATTLIEGSLANRSTGVIRLDPTIKRRGRMSRRWGLWVNVNVERADS